ncbi:MAG: sterol desaturase family protein [Nitrospiraceae bacterium]|nr:MAG: sterol desaturase family protein [Nitrospiraceae bacterium]
MENVGYIRLGCFVGIFVIMALWEVLAPKRKLTTSKSMRWFSNLSITILNTVLLRWIFPVLAIGMAYVAEEKGLGVLNRIEIPEIMSVLIAVLVLDFIIYGQHYAFHVLYHPWKLHMMHHTDMDLDVTSGARFHPIEILLSMCIKVSVVMIIGAPPLAVLTFEVLLNATAMFNHSNVNIPAAVDRILRLFVVTPDMHRVHHSVIINETNSNFGFNFPWWDRIFGTYHEQPVKGHFDMKIGLANFRNPEELGFLRLLAIPFQGRER